MTTKIFNLGNKPPHKPTNILFLVGIAGYLFICKQQNSQFRKL